MDIKITFIDKNIIITSQKCNQFQEYDFEFRNKNLKSEISHIRY